MAAYRIYLSWLVKVDGQPGHGTTYVLHFNERIGNSANRRATAGHYVGWSPNAPRRIAAHTAGTGAAIMRAVQAQGIGFQIAARFQGDRRLERYLKARHDTPRWCPRCRGEN